LKLFFLFWCSCLSNLFPSLLFCLSIFSDFLFLFLFPFVKQICLKFFPSLLFYFHIIVSKFLVSSIFMLVCRICNHMASRKKKHCLHRLVCRTKLKTKYACSLTCYFIRTNRWWTPWCFIR
jgi:hypothetical protein